MPDTPKHIPYDGVANKEQYEAEAAHAAQAEPEHKPCRCFPEGNNGDCPRHDCAAPKTPIQARDDFLDHLAKTLSSRDLCTTLDAADKLMILVAKPNMLNAFVLVNAELAALYAEGELFAPEIARVGL